MNNLDDIRSLLGDGAIDLALERIEAELRSRISGHQGGRFHALLQNEIPVQKANRQQWLTASRTATRSQSELEAQLLRFVEKLLLLVAEIERIEGGRPTVGPQKFEPKIIKILFLAANPSNETRLRLAAEATKIKEALRASTNGHKFVFVEEHAIRLDALQATVLREKATIVHFSGHGSSTGALVFEDVNGEGVEANADAIQKLFEIVRVSTRVILLNACYSRIQALSFEKCRSRGRNAKFHCG